MQAARARKSWKALVGALLSAALAAGQSPARASGQSPRPKAYGRLERALAPAQTFERELGGTEAHRYRFELGAGEFFQAVAEQRGIDVVLRLSDAAGGALASMDSPNDSGGPETLSFVAAKAGPYVLEVCGDAGELERGLYTIRRGESRPATARDRRRVEVERLFVGAQNAHDLATAAAKVQAALAGWRELSDAYMEGLTARLSKRLTAARIAAEALALSDSGAVGADRAALEKMREAQRLYAEAGDRAGEAESVFLLGSLSDGLGDKSAALQHYEKSLPLLRAAGNDSLRATALNNMGLIHYESGELLKALSYYERSLPLRGGGPKDKGEKAKTLSNIGTVYAGLDQHGKAFDYLNRALPLARESKEPSVLARVLNNLGTLYHLEGRNKEAVEFLEQALKIRRAIKDDEGAENTAVVLAQAKAQLEEFGSPTPVRPLPVGRVVEGRHAGGQKTDIYTFSLGAGQVVRIDAVEQEAGVSLILFRYDGQRAESVAEADLSPDNGRETLTFVAERGGDYELTVGPSGSPLGGRYTLTAEVRDAATPEDRARVEAARLTGEGLEGAREKSPEGFRRAVAKWGEALTLWRGLGERYREAESYNYLGGVHLRLGEMQKAFESYRRALQMRRAIGDLPGEAKTLGNMGTTYLTLGERRLALQHYELALPLLERIGSKQDAAIVLSHMGSLHRVLGDRRKALEYYARALPLFKALRQRNDEGIVLSGIGATHYGLGEKEKALRYYGEALRIHRETGYRVNESMLLHRVGEVYDETGAGVLASFVNYTQALRLARAAGDRGGESAILDSMMNAWLRHGGSPRKAILFGKQSANVYQELRGGARGLDSDVQKSLLRNAEGTYRLLAELLILDGRLDEAVQVLNLYQDQQFFDLDREPDSPAPRLALSPREQKFARLYETAGEEIEPLRAQLEELEGEAGRRHLSPAEEARRGTLAAERKAALDRLSAFMDDGGREFARPPDEQDRIPPVPDVDEMRAALGELDAATGQKTAALYTFIGVGTFYVLTVTADAPVKVFESEVSRDDLNRKLLQFYALLQSPAHDPRPVGGELYEIVFKPVEAELKSAGAQNLMWMLDGGLRYVPVAALWDGERYLAERFRNVVFTRADPGRMTRAVNRTWTGTGFGSSRAHTVEVEGDGRVNFRALPGVTRELASIFRTGGGDAGVLDGEVVSDERFRRSAFYESLKRRRPLVHVSSHFSFRPGDGSRSYLLLGDSTVLTLDDMKGRGRLFDGVELLTLSACNTAATLADASGREIDGFAELAQRLGAGSVMATLWQVSDSSTPWLMEKFYADREAGGTKAEALRNAQLALLNGTADAEVFEEGGRGGRPSNVRVVVTPGRPAASRRPRPQRRPARRAASRAPANQTPGTTRADIVFVEARNAPPFKADERRPFAHPYYWSPFVLYGNGR